MLPEICTLTFVTFNDAVPLPQAVTRLAYHTTHPRILFRPWYQTPSFTHEGPLRLLQHFMDRIRVWKKKSLGQH